MDRTAVLQKIKQAADTNATELNLSGMGLTEIPDSIAQLTNLLSLNLHENYISVIPDSITQLKNLSKLDLSDNKISVIPDSIAQLKNLSELNLNSNKISIISDSIAQLSSLSILSLRHNQIRVIPDSIAQLSNLSKLILGRNKISLIPNAIEQFTQATARDPLHAPSFLGRSISRFERGDRKGAIGDVEMAQSLFKSQGNTTRAEQTEKIALEMKKPEVTAEGRGGNGLGMGLMNILGGLLKIFAL